MYADVTTLTYAAREQDELTQNINSDLRNVYEWFNVNKLSLNITKTKCMFFGTRHSIHKLSTNPGIDIDGCQIHPKSKTHPKNKFIQTSGCVCG